MFDQDCHLPVPNTRLSQTPQNMHVKRLSTLILQLLSIIFVILADFYFIATYR